MSHRIFLSYAEEDAATAKRIYGALKRVESVSVWGYKEDGRIGAHFPDEFTEAIKQSRYFCLIDSPYARSSPWIRTECELARRFSALMVICRVGTLGYTDDNELFEGHNVRRAIDLSDYEQGVRQLFAFLQLVYSPWSPIPRDQDVETEIFATRLSAERMQDLIDRYRDFREHFGDPDFAEAQLRVLIRKCESYNATSVVSPRLALGVIYGDGGDHIRALRIFQDLTLSHPTDPRGWLGLAGAFYHLNLYDECLKASIQGRHAALTYYPKEGLGHLAEMAHNLAAVQLLLGRAEEAWETLRELPDEEQHHPFVAGIRGRLLLHRGDPTAAFPQLRQAYNVLADSLPLISIDLADCFVALGDRGGELRTMREAWVRFSHSPEVCHRVAKCFLNRKDNDAAIQALRKAASLTADSPRYRSQLAAVLCQMGQVQDARAEAERCVPLAAPTAQDRYYRGLAYYVLGKRACADEELSLSRRDAIVSSWPDYAALCLPRYAGSSA